MRHDWLPRVQTTLTVLRQGLLHLVYPGICLLCRRFLLPDQRDFCPDCVNAVANDPHLTCPRCAATVGPFTPVADGCTTCRDESLSFEGAIRLGPYQGHLREAVLKMKHITG